MTMDPTERGTDRRTFLRLTGAGAVVLATAPWLEGCVVPSPVDPPPTTTPTVGYGPLQPADANGLRLPVGFTSRVIGTVGVAVGSTGYVLPAWPDGGACFAASGGSWTYVCNHELNAPDGGVSAITFAADGSIVDARRILAGTGRNCAGGATPWGTWLSCEEVSRGLVHECDPTGATVAVARPAMGAFQHEAVAFADRTGAFYLTEDRTDGCLYRFTPDAPGDLSSGTLAVLTDDAGVPGWAEVPDPSAAVTSTRLQVPNARHFNGGGDHLRRQRGLFHDQGRQPGVGARPGDIGRHGDLRRCDVADAAADRRRQRDQHHHGRADRGGGRWRRAAGAAARRRRGPVLQLDGVAGSELAGPAFSPDGTRLYVSSQRNPGTIYEVTGPWHNVGA
ncbi:MAG: DUF839 domain-containing protein [Acidimicrobiales bacterium]